MWEQGTWLNEPRQWSAGGDILRLTADAETDFWRQTHYGFTHDNGRFLGFERQGAFTATLRVAGSFETLYDQAGLMIRAHETQWVKFGVERWKERTMFSSVLTLGRSDWAVGAEMRGAAFQARAMLRGGALKLEVSDDGAAWSLLRVAPFPDASVCRVGPTACTPMRAGLEVAFDRLAIEARDA